jgi:ketosteroid isomerase-like protein
MGEPVDAVEVVQELSRRFQAGDRDGAFALFSPDIRIVQPDSLPHGGAHRGHAGVADMGVRFAEHWDRTIADPHTSTAKPSGRSATVDVVELLTVTDGLVVEIRVFPHDTHRLLSTLPSVD